MNLKSYDNKYCNGNPINTTTYINGCNIINDTEDIYVVNLSCGSTADNASSDGVLTAVIIGGVIGGIILFLVVVYIRFRCKQRRGVSDSNQYKAGLLTSTKSRSQQTQMQPAPYAPPQQNATFNDPLQPFMMQQQTQPVQQKSVYHQPQNIIPSAPPQSFSDSNNPFGNAD